MHRWIALTCAAALGVLLALPAAAQWKWRDKSGHTQYSDLPPPAGTADADILQRPNAAQPQRRSPVADLQAASGATAVASAPGLTPKTTDSELEANKKKADQVEADKRKAEEARIAAAKADNCKRAKEQLRTLDSGVRIARTNDKGEREILDDKTRADEAKRARDITASDCK